MYRLLQPIVCKGRDGSETYGFVTGVKGHGSVDVVLFFMDATRPPIGRLFGIPTDDQTANQWVEALPEDGLALADPGNGSSGVKVGKKKKR